MTDIVDRARWFVDVALANEQQRASLAAEQAFQISVTAANVTYAPNGYVPVRLHQLQRRDLSRFADGDSPN
jgi:hypothetical protein